MKGTLTIELPPQPEQTTLNLRRWKELLDDPGFARVEGRIETDRHGQVIMSPPASVGHGSYQYRIARPEPCPSFPAQVTVP